MMLITDYHQNGSLYDFLKYNTVDEDRMVSKKKKDFKVEKFSCAKVVLHF